MSDHHNEILDNFCLWTVTEFESESRAMVEAHYLEAEKNKLSYSSALGYLLSRLLKGTIILCFFSLEKSKLVCGD